MAASQLRLDQRQADIAAIERELGDTLARLDERIAERNRVSAELSDIALELNLIRADITQLEAERDVTKSQIADKGAELDLMRGRIQGLLVNLYKQRSNRFARVFASAESFHDLRVKNHYLSLLTAQDVALVNELDALLTELSALQLELSQQITALSNREAERLQAEARLEAIRSELLGIIAELDATREGQLAQQRALLQAEADLEGLLTSLKTDLEAAIADLEAQEQANRARAREFLDSQNGGPSAVFGDCASDERVALPPPLLATGFIFPVEGAQVISNFGDDNNSYLGLRARDANAAVRSVQDGLVIAAASIGANDGFLVAIQHADGLVTAYTNLREPLIASGDSMVQGQLIGCLGGGALIPNDVLKLFTQIGDGARNAFADPVAVLGLRP